MSKERDEMEGGRQEGRTNIGAVASECRRSLDDVSTGRKEKRRKSEKDGIFAWPPPDFAISGEPVHSLEPRVRRIHFVRPVGTVRSLIEGIVGRFQGRFVSNASVPIHGGGDISRSFRTMQDAGGA